MRIDISALKKSAFPINALFFFKMYEDTVVVQTYFGMVPTFMQVCSFDKELGEEFLIYFLNQQTR